MTPTATGQGSPPRPKPVPSKAAWKKLAVHRITLHSGMEVVIRIPDLTVLLLGDAVPETLRATALGQVFEDIASQIAETGGENGKPEPDPDAQMDSLRKLTDLQRWLVVQMLVEPTIEAGDLDEMPADDVNLLTLIAIRERDRDALGVTIGVEPLHRWEQFRELHECAADCEGCAKVRERFSTSSLGAL